MTRLRRSAYAVLRILRAVGIGYVLVLGGLLLFERTLLYPMPNPASGDWNPPGIDFEDVFLTAADGTKLHGWFLPSENPRATILFFHGNGEDINSRAMFMECTFDSLSNVAAEHVRWAPVRWLMTNQYRSANRLANYQGRFIHWHGDNDPVVSFASGKRLFKAVGSEQKSFFLGSGYGHNDDSPSDFKAAIRGVIAH